MTSPVHHEHPRLDVILSYTLSNKISSRCFFFFFLPRLPPRLRRDARDHTTRAWTCGEERAVCARALTHAASQSRRRKKKRGRRGSSGEEEEEEEEEEDGRNSRHAARASLRATWAASDPEPSVRRAAMCRDASVGKMSRDATLRAV